MKDIQTIIKNILTCEEQRKEALEKGEWNIADECLMQIKRLNILFRSKQINKKR